MKPSILLLLLLEYSIYVFGASIVKRDAKDQPGTLLYEAKHDITTLSVTFDPAADKEDTLYNQVFFIEADVQENGDKVDHGLYVLKDGVATKLLNEANDISVVNLTKPIYFGTKNGIYVYNEKSNSAEKYGSVNDYIVSIAAENGTDVIYYLNKQHQLYKVTDNGEKASIIDDVKNAQGIAVDSNGNLFFYNKEKKPYVYNKDGVHAINGTPDNPSTAGLLKTPVIIQDAGLFYADSEFYLLGAYNATYQAQKLGDRTSEKSYSALSAEAGVVLYYAEDKKIYEINVIGQLLKIIFEGISKKIENFFKSSHLDIV